MIETKVLPVDENVFFLGNDVNRESNTTEKRVLWSFFKTAHPLYDNIIVMALLTPSLFPHIPMA